MAGLEKGNVPAKWHRGTWYNVIIVECSTSLSNRVKDRKVRDARNSHSLSSMAFSNASETKTMVHAHQNQQPPQQQQQHHNHTSDDRGMNWKDPSHNNNNSRHSSSARTMTPPLPSQRNDTVKNFSAPATLGWNNHPASSKIALSSASLLQNSKVALSSATLLQNSNNKNSKNNAATTRTITTISHSSQPMISSTHRSTFWNHHHNPPPPPPPPIRNAMNNHRDQNLYVNHNNNNNHNRIPHPPSTTWTRTSEAPPPPPASFSYVNPRNAAPPLINHNNNSSSRWGPARPDPSNATSPPPPPPRAPPPPPPPLPAQPPPPPPPPLSSSTTASTTTTTSSSDSIWPSSRAPTKAKRSPNSVPSNRPTKKQRSLDSLERNANTAFAEASRNTSQQPFQQPPHVKVDERESNWMTESTLNATPLTNTTRETSEPASATIMAREASNIATAKGMSRDQGQTLSQLQQQQQQQQSARQLLDTSVVQNDAEDWNHTNTKTEMKDIHEQQENGSVNAVVAGQFEDAAEEDDENDRVLQQEKDFDNEVVEEEEEMAISTGDNDEELDDDQFDDAPHDNISLWMAYPSSALPPLPTTADARGNDDDPLVDVCELDPKDDHSDDHVGTGRMPKRLMPPSETTRASSATGSSILDSASSSASDYEGDHDETMEWNAQEAAGDLEAMAQSADAAITTTMDPKLALERARANLKEAQERQQQMMMMKPDKAALEHAKQTLMNALYKKRMALKTLQPKRATSTTQSESSNRSHSSSSLPPISALGKKNRLVIRHISRSGPSNLIRRKEQFDFARDFEEHDQLDAITESSHQQQQRGSNLLQTLILLRKRLEQKKKNKELKDSKQSNVDESNEEGSLLSQDHARKTDHTVSEVEEAANEKSTHDLQEDSEECYGFNLPSIPTNTFVLDLSDLRKRHQLTQRRIEMSKLQQMKLKQEHLLAQESLHVQDKAAELETCRKDTAQDRKEILELEQAQQACQIRRAVIEDRLSQAALALMDARKRIRKLRFMG